MSLKLDFFTPVIFERGVTLDKRVLQKVDSYFSYGKKRAFVISDRGTINEYEVTIRSKSQSDRERLIYSALKTASYITVVMPFIALCMKLILRNTYGFYIRDIERVEVQSQENKSDSALSEQRQKNKRKLLELTVTIPLKDDSSKPVLHSTETVLNSVLISPSTEAESQSFASLPPHQTLPANSPSRNRRGHRRTQSDGNITYQQYASPPPPLSHKKIESSINIKNCLPEYINREIFVFGDVHGELGGFKKNLRVSGLIDEDDNWVEGCTAVAVQEGDTIDRGPKSLETYDYLRILQKQAEDNGGKLIRLLGNHELMILEKDFYYAIDSGISLEECFVLKKKIEKDISNGNLQAAWTDGVRLYLHGGSRSSPRDLMKMDFQIKAREDNDREIEKEFTIVDLENYLINRLKDELKVEPEFRFKHFIFSVGKSRGGDHSSGGIFWETSKAVNDSPRALEVPQVVAHMSERKEGESAILYNDNLTLVNVDAGLCSAYGGRHAFVCFCTTEESHKMTVYEKIADEWKKTIKQVS